MSPQGAVLTIPCPSAMNMLRIHGNSLNNSPMALFCMLHRSTPAPMTFLLFIQGIKLLPSTLASFSLMHSSFVFTTLLKARLPTLARSSIVKNQGYFFMTSLSARLFWHTSLMCSSLSLLEDFPSSCPPSQTMSAPKASPTAVVISFNSTRSAKYLSASAASSKCFCRANFVDSSLTPLPNSSLVTNSTFVVIFEFLVNLIVTPSLASMTLGLNFLENLPLLFVKFGLEIKKRLLLENKFVEVGDGPAASSLRLDASKDNLLFWSF
mmetsp:Transcript_14619/g.29984  ORF Transcript_14619/g.29984 Transcript_14619/m.29984 type:complete len:266 (+) Transcript_14619:1470-2267(+)